MKNSFDLSSLSIIIVYYITTVQTTIIPYNILTYMYIEGILCHRKSDVRGRKRRRDRKLYSETSSAAARAAHIPSQIKIMIYIYVYIDYRPYAIYSYTIFKYRNNVIIICRYNH